MTDRTPEEMLKDIGFSQHILDRYDGKERVTLLEGELALCVRKLLLIIKKGGAADA